MPQQGKSATLNSRTGTSASKPPLLGQVGSSTSTIMAPQIRPTQALQNPTRKNSESAKTMTDPQARSKTANQSSSVLASKNSWLLSNLIVLRVRPYVRPSVQPSARHVCLRARAHACDCICDLVLRACASGAHLRACMRACVYTRAPSRIRVHTCDCEHPCACVHMHSKARSSRVHLHVDGTWKATLPLHVVAPMTCTLLGDPAVVEV